MKVLSFVVTATLLFSSVAASAELNVLMSGGFSGAYGQLLPEFERSMDRVRVQLRDIAPQIERIAPRVQMQLDAIRPQLERLRMTAPRIRIVNVIV